MKCVLKEHNFECRVSSVLNKNVKSYGKQFMFDNDNETCWNSDSGNPQWILLNFEEEIEVSLIEIQFQGGFAGQKCHLEAGSDSKNLQLIQELYPEDTNSLQKFQLTSKTKAKVFKIIFENSTDFFGYANEVGEAFRSVVPKTIVWSSYVVACGYVLADTIHKGMHVYHVDSSPQKSKKLLLSTSDTLLWQGFASVIIPGLTINRICAMVHFLQSKSVKPMLKSPWISTIIGLASIPMIIHPIDVLVEDTMNATYRQWSGYKPSEPLTST